MSYGQGLATIPEGSDSRKVHIRYSIGSGSRYKAFLQEDSFLYVLCLQKERFSNSHLGKNQVQNN